MSDMDLRRRLAEHVENDLSRNEQETSLQFFGDADRYTITTYSPTMVRSLLRHSLAEIEWVYTKDSRGRGRMVSELSDVAQGQATGTIEGVRATLPIGTLTVKGSARKRNSISKIVNTPDEAEAVAEAFDS